jgi:hypothetical protein
MNVMARIRTKSEEGQEEVIEHIPNLRELPKHKESPFLMDLFLKRSDKRKKIVASGIKYGAFDQGTGEVHEGAIAQQIVFEEVDTEEFTKVYDSFLKTLFDLTPRAYKMMRYFMGSLKFGEHQVIYNPREAKEITGYTSKATIVGALAELANKGVIARSEMQNIYFINPKCMFKGDRIDMHRMVVRAKTPSAAALRARIEQEAEQRKQLELFGDQLKTLPMIAATQEGGTDEHQGS